MSNAVGRYCSLHGLQEVTNLQAGMDFRKPEYRREVFLRFYEFQLRYRSHPGCVYYLFPYLFDKYRMTAEQKLWFVFLNGNTQHPPTTLTIWRKFPDLPKSVDKLEKWFNANYTKLAFDTDRRYQKSSFITSVKCYMALCRGDQRAYFNKLLGGRAGDEEFSFRGAWAAVRKDFHSFGRLSTFSYLEYLRIAGLQLDCDQLFLTDMAGSKSHRNGLAKVLGRDDLDWHKSTGFDGAYAPGQVDWLTEEGTALRDEARKRFKRSNFAHDVGYFTMESALCTYKSWSRPNRRYPNVYNDMLHDRIKLAERTMPSEDYSDFWDARKVWLPKVLRLEDNPSDPGLCSTKQNHYRHTGQVIVMDMDWPCFANDFMETQANVLQRRRG